MWCPQCGTDTRVLETDKVEQTVTRVRWCRNGGCRFLFETQEVVSGKVVREELLEAEGKPPAKPGVFFGAGPARPKNGKAPEAPAKAGGGKGKK